MNDKVIARHLFMSCEKSSFHRSEYLILNDGNHVHDFIAKDEETAQIYFKGFIDGMKAQREMNS